MSGKRQPRRPEELIARYSPAGRDPPERDLDDILTPARSVALDDVGEFLLDPPESQRRHASPEHLAVQRMGEAERRPPVRRHHGHESPGLQGFERRRSMAALEVGQPEALTHGQQFEHRQSCRVDIREMLVDEFVEDDRRG